MDKRTFNIIMVCKGNHNFGKDLSLKQAVAHYMSKTCACPAETYTDLCLRGIIWEAFMDFMSTCTNPRGFLYHLKEARYWCDWSPRENIDDITAMLIAFQLCRVCEKADDGSYHYINGFTEELFSNIDFKNHRYTLEE